ncbi:YggS family pyridoxal phosphate-dependent enzyme [Ruficoccus sp. ZRK36]|uniref:YggS family pyridoxal phosphate-dependent enzyme n=1 Tax=Ruficoccus sp. ZRK36 TaxID=2866311 RepID=UPI001C73104B|nr:YggS family pyridoxal phosphate-dependent enzyme [Ruficoccus sp. ZRK36]QYY35922.1 YggS family pyridoxal phosphate-dependent enzyme [Ruficoccus sp. ZRK36]
MIEYAEFAARCQQIQERITLTCEASGRSPEEVSILPVTKNHPADAPLYAARYGFSAVGENRVQEAMDKQPLVGKAIRWELIGHLQSNKAKVAAEHFDRIQSVDSEKLLRKLDVAAAEAGKTLAVLLQINAGDDPAKFGVECSEADALLEQALECANLQVDGLMTIAPLDEDKSVAARCFERLRETRDRLSASFCTPLPVLSMGMTDDLEEAVKAGSTLVRIGTALFGSRPGY